MFAAFADFDAYGMEVCNKTILHDLDLEKRITLIYENLFTEPNSIKEWTLEGPGKLKWESDKMIMFSIAHDSIYKKWIKSDKKQLGWKNYYDGVLESLKKEDSSLIEKLKDSSGAFAGGHIVCWNNKIVTSNDCRIRL